jgi:putative transposase
MDLVHRHWSGKHHAVVDGINLLTLLGTGGESLIPCDDRIYDKATDGLSKNDHFRALLTSAQARGFIPECVVFDSWYGSLDNLKLIRSFRWRWVTQLKKNRRINPDGTGNRAVEQCEIAETGTDVHLEGYGFVRVFLIVTPDGDKEYWATNDRAMGELERLKYAEFAWGIAVDHRGLKQECGVEGAMVRFEQHRLVTGVSWWEAKTAIVRHAVRSYLTHPRYILTSTA